MHYVRRKQYDYTPWVEAIYFSYLIECLAQNSLALGDSLLGQPGSLLSALRSFSLNHRGYPSSTSAGGHPEESTALRSALSVVCCLVAKLYPTLL